MRISQSILWGFASPFDLGVMQLAAISLASFVCESGYPAGLVMGEYRSAARKYCCMEQFMMEKKAQLFGDETIRKQILEGRTPDQFKALGRKVQGFDQELWDRAKYSIVLNGNWCKFSQDRRLRAFLLSTGDSILAEASPYDTIWGIGLSADSLDARNPWKWRGQNLLGFALMEVRDELRRVTQNEGLCDWSLVER